MAVPTTDADQPAARPAPARVCVVGAGFAGLAAAVALADGGLEPLVLEARERVGGRVHSRRLTSKLSASSRRSGGSFG